MNTSRTPRSSRSARAARTAASAQRPMGETGSQKPQPSSAKAAARGGAANPAADGPGLDPSAHEANGVRVLKKYPNRRLYDTASSSYITLAEVKGMVMRAEPFVVRDAKTGEDLTRSILLQIILEEEAGGSPLLSEAMLCQLIRFYGHAMQGFFGAHLAAQIQAFADMQQKMMAAAPAVSAENWPKAFDNWPSNWQELMSRYAPFASSVAPMPSMSSTPSGQAWQQAQEQMQEQMQRQFQAGLQGWMDAFQAQPAAQSSPKQPSSAKSSPRSSPKLPPKQPPSASVAGAFMCGRWCLLLHAAHAKQ